MAIVRSLEHRQVEAHQRHSETTASYAWVREPDGIYLQIDTYGSDRRAIPGKKSQSIRLSPGALDVLRSLLSNPPL